MEMLSGAEMVVRSLIDQGVKHVFGYPGGAVLDIYDALHTVGGIDHVLVRRCRVSMFIWRMVMHAQRVTLAWCS